MCARELLDELRAAGISVVVRGDMLFVRPADRLSDRHRVALRSAKSEVLALLAASRDAEVVAASAAIRGAKRRGSLAEAEALTRELLRAIAAQARSTT